jgi:uncharacterized protein (TIGR00255 family)
MVRSMTAFVAHSDSVAGGHLSLEMRTVNHRYLDIHVRLPDILKSSEMKLREQIQQKLKRGRVDLQVRFHAADEVNTRFSINHEVLNALAGNCQAVKQCFPDAHGNVLDFLRWPGVMEKAEVDSEVLPEAVMSALSCLIEELVEQREREGSTIADFMRTCLSDIKRQQQLIVARWPIVSAQIHQKLTDKVADLVQNVDPDRIEQEVVFFIQKQDIAEEIQRLGVHIDETDRVIKEGGVIGRRLDFLMQELNREANTIASKSQDSVLTAIALDVKVLIEQIREQVQNIE